MALIRVTSRGVDDTQPEHEVILNTEHVVLVYPDAHKPPRGVWVRLITGDPVLIAMTFDEIWTLIQRET